MEIFQNENLRIETIELIELENHRKNGRIMVYCEKISRQVDI